MPGKASWRAFQAGSRRLPGRLEEVKSLAGTQGRHLRIDTHGGLPAGDRGLPGHRQGRLKKLIV
jgi:hypothetical protein